MFSFIFFLLLFRCCVSIQSQLVDPDLHSELDQIASLDAATTRAELDVCKALNVFEMLRNHKCIALQLHALANFKVHSVEEAEDSSLGPDGSGAAKMYFIQNQFATQKKTYDTTIQDSNLTFKAYAKFCNIQLGKPGAELISSELVGK